MHFSFEFFYSPTSLKKEKIMKLALGLEGFTVILYV